MSKIVKVDKTIILRYEDREIDLPIEIKENIKEFWNNAIKENSNLYNGQDYVVEAINETKDKIEMLVVKSNYAHYLYDERIGIKENKYRCCSLWGGILLQTKDNYFVVGEMNKTMSMPFCLQLPGGGIDKTDIKDGKINIIANINREVKEELNIDIEKIDYKLEFIEYPDETRNAYGFIALAKINQTKEELERHFNEYKEYLIKNKLELEFSRLVFLNKNNALKELDNMNNPKRPYLRNLIKEAMRYQNGGNTNE